MTPNLPFTKAQIEELITTYPTPFYIYNQSGIEQTTEKLYSTFNHNGFESYQNYYAVKALPNPHIMKVLQAKGMGFDCSSLAELLLCEKIGAHLKPLANGLPSVMFTSNDTEAKEFAKARELGAVVNFDDITHIEYFKKNVGALPELVSFRYNPGPMRTFGENNFIIGQPQDAKFGVTKEQLFEGYRICKESGSTRFGLHTMVASNELNPTAFIETTRMLLELVIEIKQDLDIQIEFINLGGGMGVNYKPEQKPLDLDMVGQGIRKVYDELITKNNLPEVKIVTENGRFVTGPHGYLITTAIHEKHIYKQYIGVNANMANLMRPGMYGAYHHINVLGKENSPLTNTYDIVGSLCENNDKFAIDRLLPQIEIGDILVIQDAGAHGHAMGFNYNGKLRSAEFLMQPDGAFKMIRRAETYEDLFRTIV
jgi:diaminopimelate decarboxylase